MKSTLITAANIDKFKPGYRYDRPVQGLVLRIGKKRKTWMVRYRKGGKYHADVLGYYPTLGIAKAREAASKALANVADGVEAVPTPVLHHQSPDVLTMGKLFDRYEKKRQREGGRIKTLPQAMQCLRANIGKCEAKPARDFSKADLRAIRDKIGERGLIAANRFLGYIGPVMRWAAAEDLITHNMVPDLIRAPEKKRKRVLTHVELAAIWHAAEHMKGITQSVGRHGRVYKRPSAAPFGRLIQFLALTLQRRNECATIRYGNVLDGIWTIADNKSDRPHSLKLPALAVSVMGEGKARDFCFSGKTGQIKGFSKFKIELDELSGVTDWTLHDLRRTARTGLQELGVAFDVGEAVMNHAIPGVAGVYMHAELRAGKEKALQLWADEVAAILAKHPAKRISA